jgi:hypothetical protein
MEEEQAMPARILAQLLLQRREEARQAERLFLRFAKSRFFPIRSHLRKATRTPQANQPSSR